MGRIVPPGLTALDKSMRLAREEHLFRLPRIVLKRGRTRPVKAVIRMRTIAGARSA